MKHAHPASRYSVVAVAAVIGIDNGTCSSARLVVGGAVPAPIVVGIDELIGQAPSTEAIAAAAGRVRDAIAIPLEDTYASGDYRRHLAEITARRAIAAAVDRTA